MWYYQQGNNRMGPVDEAALRDLLAKGVIHIDTLVWTAGMSNWAPFQQTTLSVGMATPPPPVPGGATPPAVPGRRSKVAFVLLGAFLGHFGVHNFYAGYTNNGLTQLLITILTCGIGGIASWIWAIVEICTIHKDADGVAFE